MAYDVRINCEILLDTMQQTFLFSLCSFMDSCSERKRVDTDSLRLKFTAGWNLHFLCLNPHQILPLHHFHLQIHLP
jgi:hypothetical protein